MTTAYSGDGITFPDNSVQATAPRVGMVNRIINGDMRIDQRNAGAAVTANASYPVDRWIVYSPAGSFSAQKSTSIIPESHTNSLGFTVVSAGSPSGGQGANLGQYIEGFNVSDLGWGSASAKTVTVSFWVRASIAGTYCFAVQNNAVDRSYVSEYTVSSANIWQQVNVTIAGDTTGTWLTTNGAGLKLWWDFNSGSDNSTGSADTWLAGGKKRTTNQTNLVGTSGATFYITGVQLEKGSTATDFEYVDYSRQLQMCQRYTTLIGNYSSSGGISVANGSCNGGSAVWRARVPMQVPMRANPTVTFTNLVAGVPGSGTQTVTAIGATYMTASLNALELDFNTGGTVGSVGQTGSIFTNSGGSASYLLVNAEL